MSFITPLFLAAGLTALIPVLLHLVRRLKAREVPFSTHMFLEATPIQRIRRRRLQDILLMLLRAGILALLALLFARPFIPPEDLPFLQEAGQESVVILLDGSHSMQYDTRFEEAVEQARLNLETGNEWALVRFSDAAEQLTPLGNDLSVHEAALNAQSPDYRTTDLYPAMQLGTEILQGARFEQRRIVLISDFQQSAFSPILENLQLPDDITVEPVKVGDDSSGNQFFEDVELTQERRGTLVSVQFDARIPTAAAVTLRIDAEEMDETTERTPAFQQLIERPGLYQGDLHVTDPVPGPDDHYYFTYTVRPRSGIFAVDGSPDMRNAFFLESAFDLQEASRYRFDAGPRPVRLNTVDLLIITTANAVPARDWTTIENFARNGGTVLLAFEEGGLSQTPLLGAGTIAGAVRARDFQGTDAIIAEIDDQHPIFAPLAQHSTGSVLRPQFRRYVQVTPDSSAHVLATFDTGDPLLIERRFGRGRVLVFTSSLGTAWNDLALSEVYLPLLYEIARYASPESGAGQALHVGDAVGFRGLSADEVTIANPNGDVFSVILDSTGLGIFQDTDLPGHYDARLDGDQQSFSINISPLESNLSARDVEEVYAALAARSTQPVLAPQPLEQAEQEQKLWKIVLLIMIGVFALETIFASRR